MKRAIILGAGASKSYNKSKTGVKMPVALDFFETFRKLEISENPWVLIGHLINYISDRDKVDALQFLNFSEDIYHFNRDKSHDMGLFRYSDFYHHFLIA